ncbi:uncharacterized protein LOC106143525 [Amyelois transitella]|uniref:uncharacterized protein LOC106143525 n=1 Tax=Amyelois transitella TaxID=680683 RepID=UPI00299035E2|nr:uncharacterized protein LOC106143525 [Amyelois transitella]
MLLVTLLFVVLAETRARNFNITDLIVPEVVPPGQAEVEIECRYDANFTLVNWFKGLNEFFRYKPGAAPSTRSFPIVGVGRVELIHCGPTACRLRLGALTEHATGFYKCDIERDIPPYMYNTRSAYMQVHGHQQRQPILEGLAEEFAENQEMHAYCRGAPDAEIRWYINGREDETMRGSPSLKRNASRLIFSGVPPVVTVQCAELRYGKLTGSKEMKAKWKDHGTKDERPQEQRNEAGTFETCATFVFLSVILII